MNTAVKASALGRRMRVAIVAADPTRRAALQVVVASAGHEVVASLADADVVLADGDSSEFEGHAVVTLGGAGGDHAGQLLRDADANQIDAALRAVAAGLIVRSAASAAPAFGAMDESSLQTLLTPREIDVLQAIGDGLGNKSIARRLDISPHTVKFHIESIFRKLRVRTRTEAVAKALEHRRNATFEL